MCNYSTYCDVKTGRFFGIHPCERELSMSVKDSGIYYCDTKTVKFSKNRKKIIRNECN